METKQGEMETVASGLPLPIPEGPFFDVLSRLSIKDLHRSTALSREWRDVFINFPDSRKNLPQTLQGFFYIGYDYKRHVHGGGNDGDSDDEGDGACGDDDGGDGSGTDEDGDGSGNSNGNSSGGSDRDEDEDGSGNRDGSSYYGGHVGNRDDGGNYGFHFLDLLAKSMPVPDDTDTELSFVPDHVGIMDLLCSCNGLLLFGCTEGSENYHSLGYIVCNPATKQWVTVPSSGWVVPDDEERDEEFESTFLFFDPAVPSRYLLIQFWHDEDGFLNFSGDEGVVHIYSSETGEWSNRSSEWKQFAKEGEQDNRYLVTVKSRLGSCFLNGMLHFLVERSRPNKNDDVLIVAVDGEGRICRVIHWKLDMFTEAVFIGQSQGRLHCISAYFIDKDKDWRDRMIMHVHVLQDYDAENWIKKFGIWGGELSGREECRIEDYEVVAIHPDGNFVYFVDHRKGELIQHHMSRQYEKVLRLCTLGHNYRAVTPYVPCFSRSSALETDEALQKTLCEFDLDGLWSR
ncbi:unnamed protein product [Miscanthus lutarioriparius]|uniref:F-box protein At3g26010-like beta-propeller domain-containing protein n=1 Tax=Miscanthus lutarioriparius TaxID=422564 RepID=A0A811NEM4_9POAL|nr:unnamed protein product [Miscanthus lutarioriparius]